MPVIKLQDPDIPPTFRKPTLVDRLGMPRFYVVAWSELVRNSMAESVKVRHLSSIDRLYSHVEEIFGLGALDRYFCAKDVAALEACLTAFFALLTNACSSRKQDTWLHCLRFVTDVLNYTGEMPAAEKIRRAVQRLQHLYKSLSIESPKPPKGVRSLTPTVIEDLDEIFNPQSQRNPFRTEANRWRNFLIFVFLFILGIRRSELAGLLMSSFREHFDASVGAMVTWVNITTTEESDPRYEKPGIKTAASHRQLPLSRELAMLMAMYVENYRSDAHSPFLLVSQKAAPLSVRQISNVFEVATECLMPASKSELLHLELKSVSPHELRHTRAVIQLQRYKDADDDPADSEGKLRRFFGWSDESEMPQHYGKAFFEPKAADELEQTVERSIVALKRAFPRVQHD